MSKVHTHGPKMAAMALLAVLALPTEANAIEGELTLGLGPGFADLPTLGEAGQEGFGGAVYVEYQLSTFWGLTAGASGSYHLSIGKDELPGQSVGAVWAGAIYTLDVATYVPFLSLSATGYFADPTLKDADDKNVGAGLRAGVGVDWRRYRSWSVGFEADIHAFTSDLNTYPVYLNVALRLNYHLDLL